MGRRPGGGRSKTFYQKEEDHLVKIVKDRPFKSAIVARAASHFPGSTKIARTGIRKTIGKNGLVARCGFTITIGLFGKM